MALFYAPESGINRIKFVKWVIEWFDQNCDHNHHVFLEFRVPSGRQVDFLVITPTGAYCLEAKNVRYEEIRVNGHWLYRDRRTGNVVGNLHNETENPYQQAGDTADSFRSWISLQDNVAQIFGTGANEPRLKRETRGRGLLEHFKVYPGVIIPPDAPATLIEKHSYCRLFKGPEQLVKLSERNWNQRFTISAEEIGRLASQLGLKAISVLRLLAEPSKKLPPEAWDYESYCHDLIESINRREPLLDCYIPNSVDTSRDPHTEDVDRPKVQDVGGLLHSLQPGSRLFITAAGGLGKTTCCLHICRELAKRKLSDIDGLLPVYIQLRDYRYQEGQAGIQQLMRDALAPLNFVTEGSLDDALNAGKFVWCFDGLNEAPEKEHEEIFRELKSLLSRNRKIAIVLTSRPTLPPEGFEPRFQRYDLEPFNAGQIADYLRKTRSDEQFLARMPDTLKNSPLMLTLVTSLGDRIHLESDWNIGQVYREFVTRLLQRELEKRGHQGQFEVFWNDVCRLARDFMDGEDAPKYEVSVNKAWESLWAKRLETSQEKVHEILKILVDSGALRLDDRRNTISFLHPSFQSFWHAAWLIGELSTSSFKEYVQSHSGRSFLICISYVGAITGHEQISLSSSHQFEESLKFLLALLERDQDQDKFQFLCNHMFQADPLLADACFDLFSPLEFTQKVKQAFGFSEDRYEKKEYAFISNVETIAAIRRFGQWGPDAPEDQPKATRMVSFEPPACIAADEIAIDIVCKRRLQTLAPGMIHHLCKSMNRSQFPYVVANDGWSQPWGESRFLRLTDLCEASELVDAFTRLLLEGSLSERQNAALVFNFVLLRELHEQMEKDMVDYWRDGEVVDASFSHTSRVWEPRLHLFNCLLDSSRSALAAESVEGVLRTLRIFESAFVEQPLLTVDRTQNNPKPRDDLMERFLNALSEFFDKDLVRTFDLIGVSSAFGGEILQTYRCGTNPSGCSPGCRHGRRSFSPP